MTGSTIHVRDDLKKDLEERRSPGQSYDGVLREILEEEVDT